MSVRTRRTLLSLLMWPALAFAAVLLVSTPKAAVASGEHYSCACSYLDCTYHYQRLCCQWPSGGGSPSCYCTFWVVNCVEPD